MSETISLYGFASEAQYEAVKAEAQRCLNVIPEEVDVRNTEDGVDVIFEGLSGCKIRVCLCMWGLHSVYFDYLMRGLCGEDVHQIIALYEGFDWGCYKVE